MNFEASNVSNVFWAEHQRQLPLKNLSQTFVVIAFRIICMRLHVSLFSFSCARSLNETSIAAVCRTHMDTIIFQT